MPGDDSNPQTAALLTVAEAARQVAVSRHIIQCWCASGHLAVVLIDRRRPIRPADLLAAQSVAHAGGVVPVWRQDQQRVGKRLRMLREAAGLTHLQLARSSGLTHKALSQLKIGLLSLSSP